MRPAPPLPTGSGCATPGRTRGLPLPHVSTLAVGGQARSSEAELEEAIASADQLAGRAMTLAMTLEDAGLDLPLPAPAAVDQAHLRAVASLYLASELEQADVIGAADALAALVTSGAISGDMGEASSLVHALWRSRHDRATAEERTAFFARMFGSEGAAAASPDLGENSFELDLIELCEALYKLDELATNATFGGFAQQARVRAAANRLIETITSFTSGVAVFMAQEILGALKEALTILGHPEMRGKLGARDMWAAIERIARLARRPRADGQLHLRRGRAGMTVLAWLSEAAPFLGAPAQPLVGLDHPVIAAAVDWLEASLALSEATGYQAAAEAPASPWAPIAG